MIPFNLDDIIGHGLEIPKNAISIKIKNAPDIFAKAFQYLLDMQGRKYVHKDGYEKIIAWLSDNESKGLLLLGNCSLGKTFITRYVMPAILLKYTNIVLKSYDLNRDSIETILSKKICVIDDVGTEDVKNEYGTKRMAFSEIVDNAEKNSNLLIITTNLTGDEIKTRYGLRVYERLIAITTQVAIKGTSERVK